MREFDFHAPRSLAEAIDLLTRFGPDARLMAGGTSLVLLMKQGLFQPGHIVGLRRVAELGGIERRSDGGLEIRALATHGEVERSPLVAAYCPALAEACGRVATVRIRNQGTVGGNLAHADPAQDPPPVLLALDAEARLEGPGGGRTIPLASLFTAYMETSLREDEIIAAVSLPALPAGARACYVKFLPRTADDYATVSVAALLALDPDGTCSRARVALGAAGPVPLRARRVEDALAGERLDRRLVRDAAELVRDEVDPFDDTRGSAAYKREMARVWTERALLRLLDACLAGQRAETRRAPNEGQGTEPLRGPALPSAL